MDIWMDTPTHKHTHAQTHRHPNIIIKACISEISKNPKNYKKHSGVQQQREVEGWGGDPKKCTGRDWGMGSSTI